MNNHTQENGNDNKVFVLVEMYHPKEGRLEDLLGIAKASAKMVQGQSGVIRTQVLRPKSAKDPIMNTTVWRSQAKFQAFMQSDEFKELLQSDDLSNVKEWSTDIKAMMFHEEAS